MSYARRRAEELSIKRPKKFRVIILLWEVEPELELHRGALTSASKFIKVRKRFEREFTLYSHAISVFNFLKVKLRDYWTEVTSHK